MTNDLVIKGGTVVDGTGAPGAKADVAVRDGVVSEVGDGLAGERVLDASDQVVAPGVIDVHTHYDAQVFWDPALTPSSWHGVTTVVAGNCGFSIAPCRPEHRELLVHTLEHVEDMSPATLDAGVAWDFETFPEYLDSVERRGTVINYAAYIGHTALRLYVMGDEGYDRAEATDDELTRMADVVREALAAGAAGVIPKASPMSTVIGAIATVANGEVLNNVEWASAIEADRDFAKAQLGRRERDVLHLYASGLPLKLVALQLGIAHSTAREYLDRIRAKYIEVGRPAPTKVDLLRRAVEDGILPGLDGEGGDGRR